jgi:hypothetical protein
MGRALRRAPLYLRTTAPATPRRHKSKRRPQHDDSRQYGAVIQ